MMKRSSKLALSLVLTVGASMQAMAQDNFPDAPANHWAYEALGRMKADGLLVGYPDGLYRGTRPASRYELAVAMNAVYTHLKTMIDGMQGQLDLLKGINPQDIQNLKDAVAKLQDQINAMKGWGDDIAALKRATEEFDKELRSLGVDVEAMKKDLGDLQSRVSALEKKKPAVEISGDVNFFAVSTNAGKDQTFGLTQDGRREGYSGNVGVGLFHDLSFLHEAAFTIAGTNETGPKWKGTFVVSDMLGGQAFGSQSTFASGGLTQSFQQGPEDVYVQDLTVRWDVNVIGLSFNAEAGRVAYKLNPYVLRRPDTQSYYDNERWNDGKYRFDGAIFGFNFGSAKLHVYGGNTSNLLSVDGVDLNPLVIGNNRTAFGNSEGIFGTNNQNINSTSGLLSTMDKAAGANLSFGLGSNGHINLDYLVLDQEERNSTGGGSFDNLLNTGGANRDAVYGADAEFGFGRLKISGAFHKSELTANESAINAHDNQAWNANVGYSSGKVGIWGGYREVDNDYFAPGDWGRLGIVQNPANIKGWQAGAHLDLSNVIRLTATGEWDKGQESEGAAQGGALTSSPFDTNTNIRDLTARVDFRINPNFSIFGSIEDSNFSTLDTTFSGIGGTDHASFDWTTVGFGYGLSSNAKFNLQYQFSNGGASDASGNGLARFNGGILTSQLTIKF